MKVAAVQFKARPSFDEGVEVLAAGILESRGARLVVAPEMALCGYDFADRDAVAAAAESARGPTFRAMAPLAREVDAFVVVGFAERDGPHLYNAALVIGPDGELVHVYRKSMLFEADLPWATAGGRDYRAFDTGEGLFGVGICMDLNDDHFLAWCRRVDVIALPTNWIQDEGEVVDYWRFRLHTGWPDAAAVPGSIADRGPIEAVIVGANSYGVEGPWTLRGQSAILSADRLYAYAPAEGDVVLCAEVPATSKRS